MSINEERLPGGILYGYEFTEMSDHEFAAWLDRHGWEGRTHATNQYTKFISHGGIVLAVVKYKNGAPVNRWIWLMKEISQ